MEATSNPYYKTTVPVMDDLNKIRSIIESTTDVTPEVFWAKIHPYLKEDMFALCALDMAYSDLYARKKRKRKKLYGGSIRPIKTINRLHYRNRFYKRKCFLK
jgi:hypothetical protein